ncbi:sensor histidine kinase [Paucibacter sp. B51]|uniref:sensor histidine kinase n=1 Tax=Paucibacter sp. B51 TaxID=2993315 RepID=UPI0022EC099A|nr:ATP-binding protein [Paucibacter sp. B51]
MSDQAPGFQPPPAQLPAWVNGGMAIWGTALLSLALLALAGGFLWLEYRQNRHTEIEHCALYARTLEAQTNQTLGTANLALQGLARSLGASDSPSPEGAASSRLLSQTLPGLPFVRSFSLLDENGRVIASSNPTNLDLQLDLLRLSHKPEIISGSARLGDVQQGRDLNELPAHPTAGQADGKPGITAATRASSYFVPMTLSLVGNRAPLHLVAALNPDYFANLFERQLGSGQHQAALLSLSGQLIASRVQPVREPGSMLAGHTVFRDHLPGRERASYESEQGLDPSPALGAFELARDHPWVVVVELPSGLLMNQLFQSARVVGLSLAAGLAVMAALGAMAWRALGAYDLARRELQTAHRHLATKEREQSLLIHNVQELMFRTDPEGLLQFVNHADFLSSKDQAPMLGRRFSELIDPRDQARARSLFHTGSGFLNLPIALRLLPQQGRQRVLEVTVTPVRQDNGQIHGFVGFAIDVTEREDARQRLQAQLDFTARLIDVCPIPIFAKDQQLRFVMVNQAWSEMSGVDKNLALGRKLSELRPAGVARKPEELDARLLREGGSEQLEIHERGRDYLTHRTVFTDAQGRTAGVLGSAIDVSRFVEAERQIREARDAAERTNKMKSEFVANMSHELRTPLQSIIGFSELGLNRSGEHPKLQDMFARIHTAGQRMQDLVDPLLDLSHVESTQGQLKLEIQDLRPLLLELHKEMQGRAQPREVLLALQLPPEQPLMAAINPPRLQQALRNVLDNALRFAPSGSTVDVQVRREPAGLCISVHDQGPGIPEAELESVFQPFVQGSNHKPGSGGTGLGLTIARKIMHAHGGTLNAHNHAQGGCLFEFWLPPA